MKIVGSGMTGFIGSYLRTEFAENRKWQVEALRTADFGLDDTAFINKLTGADVVINLAGATIAAHWTEDYQKLLYNSRINTTRKIAGAIARLEKKPKIFISASAVGRYAAEGQHTEEKGVYATDFLGRLAEDWEAEALKVQNTGVRTVIFRLGVVLGPDGGILEKMLPPFRLGLGGTIGNGKQPCSWVHIRDVSDAILKAIEDSTFSGIYNLCAPNPTTNEGLTGAIGSALHMPAIFSIPKFMLRLKFGEGAETFASGQTVLPKRLLDAGFRFSFSNIEEAINDIVK